MLRFLRLGLFIFLRISLVLALVILGAYLVLPKQSLQNFRILHALAQKAVSLGLPIPISIHRSPFKLGFYDCKPMNHLDHSSSEALRYIHHWPLTTEIHFISNNDSNDHTAIRTGINSRIDTILKHLTSKIAPLDSAPIQLILDIYANERTFWQKMLSEGSKLIDIGGSYNRLTNRAAINGEGKIETVYAIIQHEATHGLVAHLWGEVPTWFNEGLASYYENLTLTSNGFKIPKDQQYQKLLYQQVSQNQLIPLKDFFNPELDFWRQPNLDPKELSLLYATAWSLVYYLIEEEPDIFITLTQALAKQSCQTENSLAFFNKQVPGGLDAFEHDWQQWLAKIIKPYNGLQNLGLSEQEQRESERYINSQ